MKPRHLTMGGLPKQAPIDLGLQSCSPFRIAHLTELLTLQSSSAYRAPHLTELLTVQRSSLYRTAHRTELLVAHRTELLIITNSSLLQFAHRRSLELLRDVQTWPPATHPFPELLSAPCGLSQLPGIALSCLYQVTVTRSFLDLPGLAWTCL